MAATKAKRKYNNQTGCYKIDVFLNGHYQHSTDIHKTCKSAIQAAIKSWQENKGLPTNHRVTAFFDRS